MITLVLAMAENGVIGKDGAIPWRIADDLKRFKALDRGQDGGDGAQDLGFTAAKALAGSRQYRGDAPGGLGGGWRGAGIVAR